MNQAYIVFFAGIGGVFMGMTLLYISIRLTAAVADKIDAGQSKTKKNKEKK